MPLIVLKVICSTNSTKTLKIRNGTNSTSVSYNHLLTHVTIGSCNTLDWEDVEKIPGISPARY